MTSNSSRKPPAKPGREVKHLEDMPHTGMHSQSKGDRVSFFNIRALKNRSVAEGFKCAQTAQKQKIQNIIVCLGVLGPEQVQYKSKVTNIHPIFLFFLSNK